MNLRVQNKNQNQKSYTKPLISHSNFKKYLTEIIYTINTTYDSPITESYKYLISHNIYKNNNYYVPMPELATTPHAFGYLIDPFFTQIFVLDIDSATFTIVNDICNQFLISNVYGIDIYETSSSTWLNNYHIYIATKQPYNVMNIYELKTLNICSNFKKYIINSQDIIIRSSKKFNYPNNKSIDPKLIKSIRQNDNYKFDHIKY